MGPDLDEDAPGVGPARADRRGERRAAKRRARARTREQERLLADRAAAIAGHLGRQVELDPYRGADRNQIRAIAALAVDLALAVEAEIARRRGV